jgi:hypothetical protein
VDGKQNPKIQSLFMDKFPVFCAHFSQDGQEVFMGSRAKGFYCYDMIAGRMSFTNPIRGISNLSDFVARIFGKLFKMQLYHLSKLFLGD